MTKTLDITQLGVELAELAKDLPTPDDNGNHPQAVGNDQARFKVGDMVVPVINGQIQSADLLEIVDITDGGLYHLSDGSQWTSDNLETSIELPQAVPDVSPGGNDASQQGRLRAFYEHLHRGGQFWLEWAGGVSTWRRVGVFAPPANGPKCRYFGIHPIREIPTRNCKGKEVEPKYVKSQNAYVSGINCLYGDFDAKDFDGGKPALLEHFDSLPLPPSVIIDSGGGFHAYWLLTETLTLDTPESYRRAEQAQRGLVSHASADDGAKDLARILRIPGTRNYKKAYAPDYPPVEFVKYDLDRTYDLEEIEQFLPADDAHEHTAKPKAPAHTRDLNTAIIEIAGLLPRLSDKRRDTYGTWLKVGFAIHYELGDVGLSIWQDWSAKSPEYKEGDCVAKWATMNGEPVRQSKMGSLIKWADEDTPPDGKVITALDDTPGKPTPSAGKRRAPFGLAVIKKRISRGEQGHAEMLRLCFKNRVVYDNAQKAWYLWDGTRWEQDFTGHFHVLAANQLGSQYSAVVADLYKRASKLDGEDADNERAQGNIIQKAIRSLRGRRTIKNVLEWAQSKPLLGIFGDEWDNCPNKLPCENGIVDLKTGKFSPMTPGDYIQKMAPTVWTDLHAAAPKWEQFIADIFNDDADLIAFVQRLLGYVLLGDPREQIFPIFWGSGGNGKSTLCSVIEHVCGPLGGVAHKAIITQAGKASNPSTAQPYLMDLRGKRHAFVSETGKDVTIDEAQLKLVTGNDFITARYLNANPVTFPPTHTVILLTNPKPRLDADDDAIWRRVLLVPFTQVFKRDMDLNNPDAKRANPELAKDLQAESSGILAWLVRGSIAYQAMGLVPPSIVLDATKAYREENDSFAAWLEENCETDDKARKVKSSAALKNYNEFCKGQGLDALTPVLFRRKMKEHFGAAKKEMHGRFYYGLGIFYTVATPPDLP